MEFFKLTYFDQKLDRGKMKRIFEQKDRAAADLFKLQASKRIEGQHSGAEQRCVSISPEEKKLKQARNNHRKDMISTTQSMIMPNLFDSRMTAQSPRRN